MLRSSAIALLLGVLLTSPFLLSVSSSTEEQDALMFKAWLSEMEREDALGDEIEVAAPEVTIKNGTLRGKTMWSIGNKKIYQYLGIPFAKPPVGELRFQPPQQFDGWGDEVYNARKNPNACTQVLTNFTKADEDCLYLNVNSRKGPGSDGALLPVVVFIHGGGFILGQNSIYGGYKLLDEEVVLVTVQYRLGPLGFFSTGDDVVPGNNGMKDMVQALRWVQENIEAFGGDPNQVTVMGESAGSASSLYMLISPLAQGLFHKVIGMSGSPLQEWAIDRNPKESARRLGEAVNCPTGSSQELVQCLRGLDWLSITQAGIGVVISDFTKFKILLSGATPVIEGNVPGAFLPDDPFTLFSTGPVPDVPVMLGSTQHEGLLPLGVALGLILQQDKEQYLNNATYMRDYFLGDLLSTYGVNDKQDGASVSTSLALGFLKPHADMANFEENQYEVLDMVSSVFMKAPILRTANILSRRISSVYLYSFEYYNKYGGSLYGLVVNLLLPLIGVEKPPMKAGICHADDLIYMFRLPIVLGRNDQAFSKSYCQLFTNFVSHGTPTPEASKNYPEWPRYEIGGQNYMVLGNEFQVKGDYSGSWRQGTPGQST